MNLASKKKNLILSHIKNIIKDFVGLPVNDTLIIAMRQEVYDLLCTLKNQGIIKNRELPIIDVNNAFEIADLTRDVRDLQLELSETSANGDTEKVWDLKNAIAWKNWKIEKLRITDPKAIMVTLKDPVTFQEIDWNDL